MSSSRWSSVTNKKTCLTTEVHMRSKLGFDRKTNFFYVPNTAGVFTSPQCPRKNCSTISTISLHSSSAIQHPLTFATSNSNITIWGIPSLHSIDILKFDTFIGPRHWTHDIQKYKSQCTILALKAIR